MPTVTLPLTGRLGNLLFQYCYLRAYAEQNGYELSLPRWVGEAIFNIPIPPRPDRYKPDKVLPEETHQFQSSLIYTRKQAKEWLQLGSEHVDRLGPRSTVYTVVLNVREGEDYKHAGMPRVHPASYLVAAFAKGYRPGDIEFESDTNPTRHPYYDGNPSACGLGTTWVSLPSFYFLMTAPVLFRANSTFSWWAAALGNGKVFAPVVKNLKGGCDPQYCTEFIEGNWAALGNSNMELHLKEE